MTGTFLLIASATTAFLAGGASTAMSGPLPGVHAIPAFARKYGLPCSACHEAWPKLNAFGQTFRDYGYQIGNEKDSPIWQNPAYWPSTMRITPQWHRESASNQAMDAIPGNPDSGTVERTITSHGFDVSGVDIWTAGTLFKNISFSLLPSSDSTGAFHFENAWVRFDNMFGTPWVNLKFGKFELDNLISEKRFLFLSGNGGVYQLYHFLPVEEAAFIGSGANPLNPGFGLGDNQMGIELAGHSANSYTRYSVAVLSSNDGNVGTPNRSYDGFFSFNQAFQVKALGLQRFGGFLYLGQRPTFFNTLGGAPISGVGLGNKSFYRAGFNGDFYAGKFDFNVLYMHGWENAFLGTGSPSNLPLPAGAQAPTWNGGFIETHFTLNPQVIFLQRNEFIRMSRQAFATDPGDLGNINAYSFGMRWYPIMFSRAGLAWHSEYAIVKSVKTSTLGNDVWSSSVLTGFDFDF